MRNSLIKNILDKIRFDNEYQLFLNFQMISQMILNEYDLLLNNFPWHIKEIEFYFRSARHNDIYTHDHKGYSTGQFRIHGAGIDIALKTEEGLDGILIRSIYEFGSEFIEGPD